MTLVLDKVVEEVATKAVNKLVQTVAANIDLVSGIGSAIEDLTSDIETFNARLVDVSKNQSASELQVLKVAVKKFRAIVNKAQDAVAKYIALNKRHEDNGLAKCFDKIPVPVCGNINVCANEIRLIRKKMNALLQSHEKDLISFMNYQNKDQDYAQQPLQAVDVEEGNVTGFEDQVETIKARLTESSNNFIVIPIVGMPGTGKTTFAHQIFNSTNNLNVFVHTIWVHVSQSFDRKQKYIDILYQITKSARDQFSSIPEDQLIKAIRNLLNDKKYFIVLDDIWEKDDWDSLKAALPQNSQGSRILVTTRYHNVVDSDETHILKPLNDKVSWMVLHKIVFGKEGCHNDSLKTLGECIAKRCNGLPLSLVMVGGILRKSRALSYWKHVAENPFQEINRRDQSYHKVVRLSYDHLPHEKLRNCFLYFASFPMGQEIAALKLIRLWIAEEFIPTIDEWGYSLDLEVEAENYLKDLADRNLVIVMKKSADGQIKTCRIHDSLHEFCKTEAAKNDLFHIIDGEQILDANTISSHRRLCFHSSTPNIFDVENNPSCSFLSCYNKMKNQYPSGEQVHSLLLSSSQESDIDFKQEELIAISNAFPLLRVLDIESFKLSFLPNELLSLNLLRYLAISIDINLLPKAFKNLRELQTLVIKTTQRTLQINGGIWNMEKLRHVQTKASMQLPSPQKTFQNNTGKTNIRTLSSISPTSCTKKIFSNTPNLQKLGVRGNLAELLEEKQEICLFNNLQMLKWLENLKLYGQDENALKVPMLDKFAHRLRKLTFYKTFFKWDDIKILGSLEELEVLKLDENAFRGERWDLNSDVVFNQLQYLRIGRTNLETWTIMGNSFPSLENLVLRNCINLEEIPLAFANVQNLKVIELYHMSENATNSAREVDRQRCGKENIKMLELKITPLPPKPKKSHEQTHGEEDVNTNEFDFPSSSVLPQPTAAHEQTHGQENVNTSGSDISSSSIPPPPPTLIKKRPRVEEEYVVGFVDEAKLIKDRFFRESMNLRVISIVGMIGVGKTTFANMLFNDIQIEYEFFIRVWVYVSQAFNRRQIFLDILRSITTRIEDFNFMSDENLAKQIRKLLEGGKYFIVLDDVWTKNDWEHLKVAFPDNMRGSRILVTTRNHKVASDIDSSGIPHQLKFLNDDECWELLEKKIFRGGRCHASLEPIGRSIAQNCGGLPLAVVIIAGVLVCINQTDTAWGRIASDPFAVVIPYDERIMELMIYDAMDSQLKDCFLYFAAFPRRLEIDTRELMYLWIAEGFIPGEDLEYTAEKYLNDLVQRNLVIVSKRRADGRIKTVCIHELLHVICIREAAKQNFLCEVDGVEGGASNSTTAYCRLSVHQSVLQRISEIPKSSSRDHVQSFLSFNSIEKEMIPKALLAAIPNAFPKLKVLDIIRPLEFPQLPKELYRLEHLSYLGISTHLKLLPKEFGSLTQLQTLVFHTTESALKIEADIWNMPKLRHVLTNTCVQLPSPVIRRRKTTSESANIRTLLTISPTNCTAQILDKAPYLQKLGIRGNLVDLMESKSGISLFDNLQKLRYLENLKLLHETIDNQALRSFPRANKFPQRLRNLTLRNTSFEWNDLCVLGALNELEVLKLDEYAFRGEVWELNNVVFRRLQFLRIGMTNLVHWTTSKSCFPVLSTLIINHCGSLNEVPSDFADVDSLRLLDLLHATEPAINSALKIEKLKRDRGNAQTRGFKLSIYPPHI